MIARVCEKFKIAPTVNVCLVWGDRILGESEALFDTGTEFSIANETFMKKKGIKTNMLKKCFCEQVCSANGEYLQGIGILSVKIQFRGKEVEDDIMIVKTKLVNPLILNWNVTCQLRNDLTFPKPLKAYSIERYIGLIPNTNEEGSILTSSIDLKENVSSGSQVDVSQAVTDTSCNDDNLQRDAKTSALSMVEQVVSRSKKSPTIKVFLVCSEKLFCESKAIFDTGAEFSIADQSILKRLGATRNMLKKPYLEQACAVNGNSLYNIGVLKAKVRFGGNEVEDDIMIVGAKMGQVPLLLNWKVSCILRNDLDFPEPLGTGLVVSNVVESVSASINSNDISGHDVILPKEFLVELGYNLL